MDKDEVFLREAAKYFRKQAANSKEDMAHWAGVYNAENCERIADRIASLSNLKEVG